MHPARYYGSDTKSAGDAGTSSAFLFNDARWRFTLSIGGCASITDLLLASGDVDSLVLGDFVSRSMSSRITGCVCVSAVTSQFIACGRSAALAGVGGDAKYGIFRCTG